MIDKMADDSKAVEPRSEADVENQYYKAMAEVGANYRALLDRLAEIVAEVLEDFCIVHLVEPDGDDLEVAAFHHTDPRGMEVLSRLIGRDIDCVAEEILEQVAETGEPILAPDCWSDDAFEFGEASSRLDLRSLIAVPLETTRGDVLGVMVVGRDATSRPYDDADFKLARTMASHAAIKAETVKLTRDLQQANADLQEAVELRDTFISIASHELRTPLGAMQLLVQLMRREAANRSDGSIPAETADARLEGIERQIGRMSTLVDRLLDVSRLSEGRLELEFEPVDICHCVDEVVERVDEEIEGADADVHVHGPDQLVGRWDPERLDQIVTNLVSNAMKYGGDTIDVTIDATDTDVRLRVRDTGPGIAPEEHERIFERFERGHTDSRKGGLGLGLWIVRELVEQMGGSVELTSDLGEGAAFTVTLPREVEPESESET